MQAVTAQRIPVNVLFELTYRQLAERLSESSVSIASPSWQRSTWRMTCCMPRPETGPLKAISASAATIVFYF